MMLSTLAELARGGMGSVELARAESGPLEGQLFAVKRLHSHLSQDPQFVAMFLDEAWMTAALDSKNVVRVAAWGKDDKGTFLAIELVQGVSLTRLLKEARQNGEGFAERTVVYIASEICAGLAAAHGLTGSDGALLGLVHRDLTPSNILVSFEGDVKIVDFGIAKAEERVTQTQAGELKGKPGYMAPEQSRGGKVDARTDLFSFGVLMFELLAGRRPWPAKNAFEAMIASATEPAPALASLRPTVSPLLAEIVHKCLEKSPDDRFSSATEIQARLDAWRSSKGFEGDDRSSLADFVKRNCPKQIEWFERAIRGDLKRGTAPTFQELQEQIDEAREKPEKKNQKGRVGPAAGVAALVTMSPDTPKPLPRLGADEEGENDPTRIYTPGPDSVRRAAGGPPSSRRGEPLSARPLPRLVRIGDQTPPAPASARAPASSHAPASARAPVSQRPAVSLRGTQILPEAENVGPSSNPLSAPQSRPASVPPLSSRRGTELMPETLQAQVAAPASLPRSPLPPPSSVVPAAHAPRGNLTPHAVSDDRIGAPAALAPKRNRAGVVLLLVALPLLVLFTLWRFKHRLIEASGGAPGVTTEAAPGKPTQTSAATAPGSDPAKGAPGAATDLDSGVDASPASK
jgi:serine/threonine protein kinase